MSSHHPEHPSPAEASLPEHPTEAPRHLNRRRFLGHAGTGMGGIGLVHLLGRAGLLAQSNGAGASGPIRPAIDPNQPFAARHPHYRPRAQRVLMVFCCGGLSHLDTFDFKPDLIRHHDQPLPSGEKIVSFQGDNGNLVRPLWKFRPAGQSGKMISDLFPHMRALADEMAFIHSMTSESSTHGPAETFASTGFTVEGYPSIGSWVSYALGTEDQDLPAFVAIPDPRGVPQASANDWGAGFLPAEFQGASLNTTRKIRYLHPPDRISGSTDVATRGFLRRLNEHHLRNYRGDSDLAARIASYELAARMQLSVPDVTELHGESPTTLRLYGADDEQQPVKRAFARNCILARRLLERGVRFIQLFNGAYSTSDPGDINWDAHAAIEKQYKVHGPILDQPVAGLLQDLRQRGLLDDTLVVFCTEFGRYPMFQKGSRGRDHNPQGFTAWLAGGGVKAGVSFGATDELGIRAVQDPVSMHDLHATILHQLGLDHERLTYRHNGREQRLTDVHGDPVQAVLQAT